MSSEFSFQLRQVSKRFVKGKETISIFDHLDLDIPAGDFVAVMGPSGSGKTTVGALLAGQVGEAAPDGWLARVRRPCRRDYTPSCDRAR